MPIGIVEGRRLFEIGDGFADIAVAKQHSGYFAIDLPRFRIDLESRPNLLLRLFGTAFLLEVSGFDAMSLGKRGIEFDCPFR